MVRTSAADAEQIVRDGPASSRAVRICGHSRSCRVRAGGGQAERRRDLRIIGPADMPAPSPLGGGDGAAEHGGPEALIADRSVLKGNFPGRLGKRAVVGCRHARYSGMPGVRPFRATIARAWTFR